MAKKKTTTKKKEIEVTVVPKGDHPISELKESDGTGTPPIEVDTLEELNDDNIADQIQHAQDHLEKQVDELVEMGMTHEQIEDALIAEGMEADQYGEYLDSKFKKKTEDDGASFLDDGVVNTEETDASKEMKAEEARLRVAALELEEKEKAAAKKIDDVEAGKSSVDKSHALPHVTNDMTKETKKPTPKRVTEEAAGEGKVSYTKWLCPTCGNACHQINHKWECKSPKCLYGKAKPLAEDDIPKEIVRYKLLLEDLGCSVHKVKMYYVGNGRYKVKEGQEEYIAKQVIKILNRKTWKQLTAAQIKYLAEYDKTK